jgi:secondary thiamine-phosphate synthase enzyme
MRQTGHRIEIRTPGRGLVEITAELKRFIAGSGIRDGLLTVFCRHTSASLLIQENADPDVRRDLDAFFARLVRDGDPLYAHAMEGADDMPAHIRSALTQTSLGIPVQGGAAMLGTWQGVFVWEHRTSAHRREIVLQLVGD